VNVPLTFKNKSLLPFSDGLYIGLFDRNMESVEYAIGDTVLPDKIKGMKEFEVTVPIQFLDPLPSSIENPIEVTLCLFTQDNIPIGEQIKLSL